jgi:methyl-accepting chemotaxis protein
MFSKYSIQFKYSAIFILAMVMVGVGFVVGIQDLKLKQLRNEATAVAEQVVSFRSWVARTGVVWVDKLSPDFHDFLGQKMDRGGEMMFSKNPALATRELSDIVSGSSTRATFRVTSDEYRNPKNAPDAFEQRAIQQFKSDTNTSYVDNLETGVYRYAQPIYVKEACLRCHSDPAKAPPEVIEKYGDKRAFGYKVGDVRGIISVNLPDIPLFEVTLSFINPVTVGLVSLAFLMSFFYTEFALIRRLKNLTGKAEKIAKGDLSTPIETKADSRDEMDHLAHAMDMLRKSLTVAMKHMKK